MTEKNGETNNKQLYALLNVSPEASDEEIRKAYRQWAQVYHPDKHQSPHMKDIATENFQRVCEAYEILTDENKRIIYDIYGMEGLTSGLELGPKLEKVDEIKEELERLKRQREKEKAEPNIRSSGSLLANLSWPDLLDGDGFMRGMAMATEVQSQISKRTSLDIGGNLAVNERSGGGAATAILRHQVSPVSSVELMGSMGLQSLVGIQTSRQLSVHSTASLGITASLRDGSLNLSNTWSRQLSETSNGKIQLSLGEESSIGIGWRKKEQKVSASGEIKVASFCIIEERLVTDGQNYNEVDRHWRLEQAHLEQLLTSLASFPLNHMVELLAQLEDLGSIDLDWVQNPLPSMVKMRFEACLGARWPGLIWKFELHRGGQKLVIPVAVRDGDGEVAGELRKGFVIRLWNEWKSGRFLCWSSCERIKGLGYYTILLSHHLNPVFATGAFIVPISLYFTLKNFVFKPYYLRWEKQKSLENREKTKNQVEEAINAATKAQQLLQNVANRKKIKQEEMGGLVVVQALYGSQKALLNRHRSEETGDGVPSQIIDITVPLNFLVTDSGKLKENVNIAFLLTEMLHEGVKKSGIMGSCDPCPGEPKQLYVKYTYDANIHEVTVGDYDELLIPQESHKV
ncbi:hypothetical protein SASPL_130513 [Salvia splendens]|uniref:J domain-containing protein n=1 Tax=Salvia splendens TaxID=180675 RepID=A0A8X8X952_SALSN|nr:hypothetical protein SASPL_130513 [Salvia splendens]